MTVLPLPAFNDNYIWIIVNEMQHTLTCVDPGTADPVLKYAKDNGLTLSHILITHHHQDHAGGVPDLLQKYPGAKVYGPDDSRIPEITTVVHDEDIVHIDNLALRVLSTPGHTSTHICFQEPTKGWLFCGDTLFSAGCGRVFDGTIEALHHSITLLKHLPKDTQVYCGHEYTLQNLKFSLSVEPENETIKSYYHHLQETAGHCSLPSTIALEREINPFMRTTIPAVKAFAETHHASSLDSLGVFKVLRDKKNNF